MSAKKQANDSKIISQRECIQKIHWKNYLGEKYLQKHYQESNENIWQVSYLVMDLVFRGGDY